jgi:ethanolamine permease
MMILCLAEMSSVLPFSGGIYGLTRVTLGSYWGYVIAILELFLNFTYCVINLVALSQIFPIAGLADASLNPLYSISIWIALIAILVVGGSVFWTISTTLAVACLVLQLLFVFSATKTGDFDQWSGWEAPISGQGIIYALPCAGIFLSGIQYTVIASAHCSEPAKQMPTILLGTFLFLVVLAFTTLIAACAQYPGPVDLSTYLFPLAGGFAQLLNISENTATLLTIPPGFGSALALLHALGSQTVSVAKSGYFPGFLSQVTTFSSTPYIALLVIGGLGYLFCVIAYYDEIVYLEMGNVSAITSYLIFIFACLSYISFTKNYPSLKREFCNPFGMYGAYLGVAIFSYFLVNSVLLAVWQKDPNFFYIFLVIFVPANILYFFVIMPNLKFSEEEKKVMFKAYLVKANAEKREKLKKRGKMMKNNQVAPSKTSNNSQSGGLEGSDSKGDYGASEFRSVEMTSNTGLMMGGGTATRELSSAIHSTSVDRLEHSNFSPFQPTYESKEREAADHIASLSNERIGNDENGDNNHDEENVDDTDDNYDIDVSKAFSNENPLEMIHSSLKFGVSTFLQIVNSMKMNSVSPELPLVPSQEQFVPSPSSRNQEIRPPEDSMRPFEHSNLLPV